MRHGFTRITGIAVAGLLIGSGPAWAGAYKDMRTGPQTQGSPSQESPAPGSPSVGGTLDNDMSMDHQGGPNVKAPDEPSASPRMETQPGARNPRPPGTDRPAPRSEEHLDRPDAQSPRSDDSLTRPPRSGDQPFRSYKQ
jgi:hypothetical protein